MLERYNLSFVFISAATFGFLLLPRGASIEQPQSGESSISANRESRGSIESVRKAYRQYLDTRKNALKPIGDFFGRTDLFVTLEDFWDPESLRFPPSDDDLRRVLKDTTRFVLTRRLAVSSLEIDGLGNQLAHMLVTLDPWISDSQIRNLVSEIMNDMIPNGPESHSDRGKNVPDKMNLEIRGFRDSKINFLLGQEVKKRIHEAGVTIDTMLVTIPDPEDSHFAYMYDRQIESIKRAADDESWVLDRFWFPWESEESTSSIESESKAEKEEGIRRRLEEPGLLLFSRSKSKLLAVFLIGETPTSGINKTSFRRALEYRSRIVNALSRGETDVQIVSPTFSGSLTSLVFALRAFRDKEPNATVRVFNGSAQIPQIEGALRELSDGKFKVDYQTTKMPSNFQAACFREFYEKLKISVDHVALIRDDTSFGRAGVYRKDSPDVSKDSYVWQENIFTVSMHLSRIRSAYERDPGLRLPQRPVERTNPRRALELSIEERGHPRDSPQAFSPMTSQTEELVLASLLSQISRRNYKLIGITMSDTRDVLFLGRLIERYCSDVRTFTFLSDVAYTHPDYLHLFHGMLVIADYPLFDLTDLKGGRGDRIPTLYFPSQSAEGVYYATSMAISDLDGSKKVQVPNMRAPWLGIVSSQGIWPVEILSMTRRPDDANAQVWQEVVTSATRIKDDVEKSLFIRPPLSFWLLFLGVLAFATVHAMSLWNWRRTHKPREDWHFWKRFRWSTKVAPDVRAEQIIYGIASTGSLVVVLVIFGSIFKALNEHPSSDGFNRTRLAWVACAVGVVVLSWLALPPVEEIGYRIKKLIWHQVAGIAVILFLVSCVGWTSYIVLWHSDGLLLHRFVSLANGVTPITPFLLLMTGLYIWSVSQLTRISDYEERHITRPLAALCADTTGPDVYLRDFDAFCKEIGRGVGRFVFSTLLFRVAACIGLVSFLYLLAKYASYSLILSIEGRGFDFLLLFGIYAGAWLGAWGFTRMIYLWRKVQRLLRQLELLPMREAFAEIGEHLSWKSVWLIGTRVQTLTIRAMTIDCLRVIASTQGQQALTGKRLDEIQAGTLQENRSLEEFWGALENKKLKIDDLLRSPDRVSKEMEEQLSETGNILMTEVLSRAWNNGGVRNPLVMERLEGAEAFYEDKVMAQAAQTSRSITVPIGSGGSAPKKSSPQSSLHWLKLAEQFVALRFAAYLRPILLQIRNLITQITVGYVILLLVMTSYPFHPHRLLLTLQWGILLTSVAGVMWVLVQMQRDPILSRLSGTRLGKVDWNREFFGEVFKFGVLPVFGLLAAEFPQVGNSLFFWLEPLLRGVR